MPDLTTSETLNLAADLIEERGWTAGVAGMEVSGPVCLEGAISIITDCGTRWSAYRGSRILDFPSVTCPAYRAVWNYLQSDSRWGFFRARLYDWNDTPGRTQAEVVAVLRATAVIESAREVRTTLAGLPGSPA